MDAVAAHGAGPGAGKPLGTAAIELAGVTLARDGRTILSDVSFSIRPGEFIGIFGPNGAGKTTLLQAILGLLRPKAGALRVFGEHPSRGNRGAGYLPQQRAQVADLRLLGWDFVASALHGERWGLPILGSTGRAEVARAIGLVDASTLARRPLYRLSGGELQRLLLAQALLGRPKMLLLDEPLISLDPHFQQAAVALVKQIQRDLGITVLFTAHDINPLLGFMDRVLYLGHGQAALGTVDEVITSEVLSRLYRTSIDVFHLQGRILVVSAHGPIESHPHLHDA
ncbi:MAG TPA: ATP-binding cassette domain-containing protein [Alphaproteobacteria bacterium]|nr:ATP-binding cassette domain-containing protein [Alphaproteobacteria bacterium]